VTLNFAEEHVKICSEEKIKYLMKKCNLCNIVKDLSEFRKGRSQCKKCISEKYNNYHKEYYVNNKDFLLSRMKENYLNNIDERKQRNKKYREENKDELNEYNRVYRLENAEKIKEYKENNKDYLREYNTKYWSKRMKDDDLFRFKSIMRKSIGNLIKNKSKSTQDIIGCSFEELKIYLESKFETWMNWGNYGLFNGEYGFGWDIDHIIPLSSAESEEDVIKLCHFTNLQPLCSKINRYEKKDKIIQY
jgi:hypothetical protein